MLIFNRFVIILKHVNKYFKFASVLLSNTVSILHKQKSLGVLKYF